MQATDLKVFTTRAVATVLEETDGDTERRTARHLSVTTDVAIRLVRRVKAGEAFDLLVAAPGQFDELMVGGRRDEKTSDSSVHHAESRNRLSRVSKARLGSRSTRAVSGAAMTAFLLGDRPAFFEKRSRNKHQGKCPVNRTGSQCPNR